MRRVGTICLLLVVIQVIAYVVFFVFDGFHSHAASDLEREYSGKIEELLKVPSNGTEQEKADAQARSDSYHLVFTDAESYRATLENNSSLTDAERKDKLDRFLAQVKKMRTAEDASNLKRFIDEKNNEIQINELSNQLDKRKHQMALSGSIAVFLALGIFLRVRGRGE